MDFQQVAEQAKDARHAAEDVIELLNNLQFAAEDEDGTEVKKIAQSVRNFFFTLRREVERIQPLVEG